MIFTGFGIVRAGYTDPSIIVKVSSVVGGPNQPILVYSGSGTSAILSVLPRNFSPTQITWIQVPDISNRFATTGSATFASLQAGNTVVKVTLPAKGIYQFKAVATNGTQTAARYFWINVWDSVPALAGNGVIGRNPGINPPTSVQLLSNDPGPFCHPRIFFSRADWAALNAKDLPAKGTNPVPDASEATAAIQSLLAAHFDKAGDPFNQLAKAFAYYANSNYSSSAFANLNKVYAANVTFVTSSGTGGALGNPGSSFYDALTAACYLAWIETNPGLDHTTQVGAAQQARFNYLASITAAASEYEYYTSYVGLSQKGINLNNHGNINGINGNGVDGNNHPLHAYYTLAVAYDYIYDWMSTPQQAMTRNYLFAEGNIYNGGGGGLSRSNPGVAPDGSQQNGGDFPNLADGIALPSLAIEGEESLVNATVLNYAGPYVPAASSTATWPHANATCLEDLQRQIHYNSEFMVTPWGFVLNMMDYFQLGSGVSIQGTMGFSRRGENEWVTTNLYQAFLHALYNLSPRESDNSMALFDHHDGLDFGNGPGTENEAIMAKYMYPDDPMVDYVYRAFHRSCSGIIFGNNVITTAMFAVPALNAAQWNLNAVAANKGLALTKLDPFRCVAESRNGWNENDLNLLFENRYDPAGHNHGERNTFSLYALGRAWACPPGYHVTISDFQSQVMIQEADLDKTDASEGYIGTCPNSYFQARIAYDASGNLLQDGTDPRYGGPFSGALLEATEEPGKTWTWFAGDAAPSYNYHTAGNRLGSDGATTTTDTSTPYTYASLLIPGALENLIPADQQRFLTGSPYGSSGYNTVKYAYRSILTAKGTYPYVIVIDDINKDNTAHNYRWTMSCAIAFGGSGGRFVDEKGNDVYSSLAIDSTATTTATDTVLLHSPIDSGTKSGLPRLLVRDLNGQIPGTNLPANAPAIRIEDRPVTNSSTTQTNLTYGYDNNQKVASLIPSRRLFIDRPGVVTPNYKVLLFPYYTGGVTPTTNWSADGTTLTVSIGTQKDTITFNSSSGTDHRTRMVSFVRTQTGLTAPTLVLPQNMVVVATSLNAAGLPVAYVNYAPTAHDSKGNILTPVVSIPSGSPFQVGVTKINVTAQDFSGQEVSGSFTVTVNPSAPIVSVTAIANSGSNATGPFGITLSWPYIPNVTGYNVKRGTSPGGPFTTIGANVAPAAIPQSTTFSDSGVMNTNYYYVVTALSSSTGFESANSNVVTLVPPASSPLVAQGIGLTSGVGAYQVENTYLLSIDTLSGSSVGAFSDGASALLTPWTGDGIFTAHLASYDPYGGAFYNMGIDFRASTQANAVESFIGLGANNYANLIYRPTVGALASSSRLANITPLGWYRLIRSGNIFTGYYSPDGIKWTEVGTPQTIVMPAAGQVGLMMGAGQGNQLVTSSFDNVVFLSTPIATGGNGLVSLDWSQSLGASSYSVYRATNINGPYSLIASGLTSANYTDYGLINLTHYYYKVMAYSPGNNASLSFPVMGEPSLYPAPILTATPGNGTITLTWTAIPGATDYMLVHSLNPGGPFPVIRKGLTTTSCSFTNVPNGVAHYFAVAATNPANVYGLFSSIVRCVAVAWKDYYVGGPATAGSFTSNNGILTVGGEGADISGTSDAFNFVYRPWTGDGVWIAHLSSMTNTNGYAKAGVIFRASGAPGAQYEAVLGTPSHGVVFQSRTSLNGGTGSSSNSGASNPQWLKLTRVGNSFTAASSPDASTWTTLGNAVTNTISGLGYVGLAVTSHNNGTRCNAIFDHVACLVVPTNLIASNTTSSSVTLAWASNPNGSSSDATATEVDYSPAGANTWTELTGILVADASSYTITGLAPSTHYDFRVKSTAGSLSTDYAVLTNISTTAPTPNNSQTPPPLASPYQQWLISNGLSPSLSDYFAPDGDNIPVLLKYATGMKVGTASATGPAELGDVDNYLTLKFNRLSPAPVNYIVEVSSNLTTWAPIASLARGATQWSIPVYKSGTAKVSETGANPTVVTVTDQAPLGLTLPRFLRLRITTSSETTIPGTTPQGYVPVTLAAGSTTATSFTLDNTPVALDTIRGITSSSVIVVNAGNWSSPSLPYGMRFLSGNARGITLPILSQNGNILTLATRGVDLTKLVAAGDTYEILPLDTLGTVFGTNTVPFQTGTDSTKADLVELWNGTTWVNYYNNGSNWYQTGLSISQNNVLLPPGQGLLLVRHATTPLSLGYFGRVANVPLLQYVDPGSSTCLGAPYPVTMTLTSSGLAHAANWLSGSATTADLVSLWNGASWVPYFFNGNHWFTPGSPLIQDNRVISLGEPLYILRRGTPSPEQAFIYRPLPFTP